MTTYEKSPKEMVKDGLRYRKLAEREIKAWQEFQEDNEIMLSFFQGFRYKNRVTIQDKKMVEDGFPFCYKEKGVNTHCKTCVGYWKKRNKK